MLGIREILFFLGRPDTNDFYLSLRPTESGEPFVSASIASSVSCATSRCLGLREKSTGEEKRIAGKEMHYVVWALFALSKCLDLSDPGMCS